MILTAVTLLTASKLPAQGNTKQILLAQTNDPAPGVDTDSLPASPLPDERQTPTPGTLPPVEDFLDSLPNQLPGGETPESNERFKVKKFKLEGNTVLEQAAVDSIFRKYRDRQIGFADLLELETDLTKLYTAKGYVNSGVVLPIQNVTTGTVVFQSIEGIVETINVQVDGRLKESYVRSRLARGAGQPLNIGELQEALQLLQLNPLIENLNAELSVGGSRDRWTLDVAVNQGNPFKPLLFVNNNRTPSVGSFQRGLELNHNNVLGYADQLSFVYKNTDGSNDFDTSYRIPVNSLDGTVGLRYRFVDSKIIEGNFEDVDIESQTDELELTLRQPILRQADGDSTQELALGLELSRQTNEVTLEDQPFPDLSPGADENGETKISAVRFFQDWTRRTRKDVLAARSQLSAGVDVFDATVNNNGPDGKFVAWRGQVQWLRQLKSSSNINLLLRSDIQLSTDDLVSLERFSLGGVESVRGYRQDALLGDSGILTSAEVRIPFYRWSNNQNSLTAVPFVDFGTTWSNSDDRSQEEDTVASLGLGLRLDLLDTLNARLDYGIPLIEVQDNDDTLQEQGIYFSLEYFPF
ncbi:MAG: ShlB/FhaC/HecB family hemolysin secretion/activation protein [Hydrococcus sp. SU_1_0]|nr:ShlB/FhaC/HecB family hemolysin secretion/activation protein [Hydrococcus sp. SU_1_0]